MASVRVVGVALGLGDPASLVVAEPLWARVVRRNFGNRGGADSDELRGQGGVHAVVRGSSNVGQSDWGSGGGHRSRSGSYGCSNCANSIRNSMSNGSECGSSCTGDAGGALGSRLVIGLARAENKNGVGLGRAC